MRVRDEPVVLLLWRRERERVGAAGRRLGGPRRGGKNTNGGRSRVEGGFKEEVGGIYGRRPP